MINLAPRKIKGIESQGMILMAEDSTGKLNFVNTVDDGFENGSEIRWLLSFGAYSKGENEADKVIP